MRAIIKYPCIVCEGKSELKQKVNNFAILSCKSCGMIFVDRNQIARNYQKQYENNITSTMKYYSSIQHYDIKSFYKRLDYLKKYYTEPDTLFEIGSGMGTFLKIAIQLGWQVAGTEPNKRIYSFFKKETPHIKLYNSFFDQQFIAGHKAKYD